MGEAGMFIMPEEKISKYLEDIVGLNKEIFSPLFQNPYGIHEYKKRFDSSNPLIILSKDKLEFGGFGKNNLVGNLIAYPKEDSFYIWLCGVRGNWRNCGIANNMIDICEKKAKERGFSTITSKTYNISNDMQKILIKKKYLITDIQKNQKDPRYNAITFKLFL